MPEQTIHLHRDSPIKPAEGHPCNGCGVCCALETCPAARLRFLQIKGPCPALQWSEAELCYRCGLLANPRQFLGRLPASAKPYFRKLLGRWIAVDQGCDCSADVQS